MTHLPAARPLTEPHRIARRGPSPIEPQTARPHEWPPRCGRRLPGGCDLQTIDGMSEREVASALKRSRIFMSFFNLEGLGLPPIEAHARYAASPAC